MEEASLKAPLVSPPEDDSGDLHPPLGPSLWQLCSVISVSISCVEYAGGHLLLGFLKMNGWFDDNFAGFLWIMIVLGIIFYTAIEVFAAVFSFSFRGKDYGFWALLVYRVPWFKKHDNFISQTIAPAILILEEGFSMFDAPATDTQETAVVIRIQRRIRADHREDYEEWMREANEEITHFGGEQLGSEWSVPETEYRMATQQRAIRASFAGFAQPFASGEKMGANTPNLDEETATITHTINIRFWSLGALDLWLSSPKYLSTTQYLAVMLTTPDNIRVLRDNPSQNEAILFPKKWKVWMINTLGFYCSAQWTKTYFAPYYVVQWNLLGAGKPLLIFVITLVINFMGFYLFSPLVELIFNSWLIRKPDEKETSEPWRTLNDGFSKLWMKIVLIVSFYGGLIVWRAAKGDWGFP